MLFNFQSPKEPYKVTGLGGWVGGDFFMEEIDPEMILEKGGVPKFGDKEGRGILTERMWAKVGIGIYFHKR